MRIPSILRRLALHAAFTAALAGCAAHAPRQVGGGLTEFHGERRADSADVALGVGYRIEVVAEHLTFPTGVAFDAAGQVHVIECGTPYGTARATPRLLRVLAGGGTRVVAHGGDNGPWNGVAWWKGAFYVTEGGAQRGGAILKISPAGRIDTLLAGLPSMGEHPTSGIAVRDGWIYFGQGSATNSGVVGEDDFVFGWPLSHPDFHDVPCRDVTLTGINFTSRDRRPGAKLADVVTGAFLPYGTASVRGLAVFGQMPCSGSILRIKTTGGPPELVAWGFRNPFGLAFDHAGALHALDLGYDDRGSRPVRDAGDLLIAVRSGAWYGWPDYHGSHRLDSVRRDATLDSSSLAPLIQDPPAPPPPPLAVLAPHATATGIDFSTSARFGHVGSAFVAQYGDLAPMTGTVKAPVGFKVVCVDPKTGVVTDFAINRAKASGPASLLHGHGLERPIALRFSPDGSSLYVVDFGVMTIGDDGPVAHPGTGVLWRITRAAAPARAGTTHSPPPSKQPRSSGSHR